ncbi:hypothetical protein BLNAU_24037 [Blattamonas nauphoetae]|uniref:Sugar phosphate transporter domain-containing protein n=1 Tax=Blattamonas nauphoetae TaxID=2049346 RepID=A0ABQ9WNK5_9EUKA|nr:hypothetical protein BLNAU_24037 [Blattamonas nauphoetae]
MNTESQLLSEEKSTKRTSSATISCIVFVLMVTIISIQNQTAGKHFKYPHALSLDQSLSTLLFTSLQLKLSQKSQKIDKSKVLKTFPIGLSAAINFVSNLKCLQVTVLSTMSIFYNINLLFVALFETFFLGRHFHKWTKLALFIIFAGALIYCASGIKLTLGGCFWLIMYLTTHNLQPFFTKRALASGVVTSDELPFYNALCSTPILLCSFLLSGEWRTIGPKLSSWVSFPLYTNLVISPIYAISRFSAMDTLSLTAWEFLSICSKIPGMVLSSIINNHPLDGIQMLGIATTTPGAILFQHFSKQDTYTTRQRNDTATEEQLRLLENSEEALEETEGSCFAAVPSILSHAEI